MGNAPKEVAILGEVGGGGGGGGGRRGEERPVKYS